MTAPTLHVCFLWHMHQPPYRDPLSGDVVMPWVRLHGLKDYTDMALALESVPGARATVNWVPVLLDQLEEAAAPDHPSRELFWRLSLAPPELLSPEDRDLVLRHFFSADERTMIAPRPRYAELQKRVRAGESLDPAALRDLQTWFGLAWCGRAAADEEPEISRLLGKGHGFDAGDQAALRDAMTRVLGRILPRWRSLASSGRVELTTSPYHHPILPLLVSTDHAREADPSTSLPRRAFRFPGDARTHVERAVRRHEERFGTPPRGLWPSEGSVSAEVISIARDAGIRWLATDEALLRRSLGRPSVPPSAHLAFWESDGLALAFRDHDLSDRIGFVYAAWDPADAVRDFVARTGQLRRSLGRSPGVVLVALDGENCWETYPGGVTSFLPALYEAVAKAPGLRLSTVSEALEDLGTGGRRLDRVAPGSWIDGTFRTWLGDPTKNRAWELLAETREAAPADLATAPAEVADPMLRAEASDWWWWLGAGHSSDFDAWFERLFRHHLAAVWKALGKDPPAALGRPIAAPEGVPGRPRPSAPLRPPLTGRRDLYFPWAGAGEIGPEFGAIHRAASAFRRIRYGADPNDLSLRVETAAPLEASPAAPRIALETETGEVVLLESGPLEIGQGLEVVRGSVLDARVPLARAGRGFAVLVRDPDGRTLERVPSAGLVSTEPDRGAAVEDSEYRQDPFTGDVAVIAPGRGRRPLPDSGGAKLPDGLPCAFCGPGDLLARVISTHDGPEGPVRVAANRWPALRVEPELHAGGSALFSTARGLGAHEVVVESPAHAQDLPEMATGQVAAILLAWRDRIRDLHRDLRLSYVTAFRNRGARAGATVAHPHSQVMATAIVPPRVESGLRRAASWRREHGTCLGCALLGTERIDGRRIVRDDRDFVTLAPFASPRPFCLAVLPSAHQHDFGGLSDREATVLARHLQDVLRRLDRSLDRADYNLAVVTAPNPHAAPVAGLDAHGVAGVFHWRIEIIPHTTRPGGFERGTGVFVNPVPPEVAAEHLRTVDGV